MGLAEAGATNRRFRIGRRALGGKPPAGRATPPAAPDNATALAELRFRRVHKASVVALATLAEHKDPYASQHILRVSRLTDEIARALQHSDGPYRGLIDGRFRELLRVASMLHDVGKVTIPDGILQKPGRLDPEERALMQNHSNNGRVILERAARLSEVGGYLAMGAEIAGFHHEKFDGSGYPQGLKGEAIPLPARIVAIADVFDALTHRRSYKEPWSQADGLAYVRDRAGTEFDPVIVEAFQAVMEMRAAVTIITWNEDMSVGVEDLDNDHRTLIDLINQLAGAESRRDRINLEAVLDELVDYTVFHFEKEEQYMERAGYPALPGHKRTHGILTEQVLAIRRRVVDGGQPGLGDEVLEFLGRWLSEHILQTDALYRPYLACNSDEESD